MTDYFNPASESFIESKKISQLKDGEQVELMENWFRENYEDPALSTPYSSQEGGYVFILGGPYNAYDELFKEFFGPVDDDLITKLADELSAECEEWAPSDLKINYESELIKDIATISQYCQNFSGAISDIEAMLSLTIPSPQQTVFLRLIYANVITALETYLGDAFVNNVMAKPELLRTLVETTPEFKNSKISLSEIFKEHDDIQSKVEKHLAKILWHRLHDVSSMYKYTLNVNFPRDTGDIYNAIKIRHDIVHRNGKNKDGNEIILMPDDVRALIQKTETLVNHIDLAISEKFKAS